MPIARIEPNANAFTFSFDPKILEEIQDSYNLVLVPALNTPEHNAVFAGGKQRAADIGVSDQQYFYTSYGEEPLFWVSNNNQTTYDQFKRFFNGLNIAENVKELVDFESDIRVYCGFFVVGNRAEKPYWHMDYAPGANAYTLITPLFDLDPGHGNLIFKDQNDGTRTYDYKLGEGIMLGDHFLHSTQPYDQTAETRVLLSITFGSDKLDHWEALKQTVGGQSKFSVLPCGHQMGTCQCLEDMGKKFEVPEHFDEKMSRNALCPCGSGKRFKNCHGKI